MGQAFCTGSTRINPWLGIHPYRLLLIFLFFRSLVLFNSALTLVLLYSVELFLVGLVSLELGFELIGPVAGARMKQEQRNPVLLSSFED